MAEQPSDRSRGPLARIGRVLVGLYLLPLRLYRTLISPLLGQRCRYYPSCSAYAEEAVRELGIIRGSILAGWRLVRCNPFCRGGYDPLDARTLFRSKIDHDLDEALASEPAPPPPERSAGSQGVAA